VSTATVTAPASSTATSGVTTPLVVPAIPGFPWESIIAGLVLGISALVLMRERRKSSTA
jgi:hypothetical protein